ncbi:unnamed protein product [Mytilus edulis]|uniref:Integrase zinc-binding domain-containing protein n=1 Tax=Mytilus edulis TaxID=6550 RepID=A0A8S3Q341_MYTED|nr:unnamed protein product [Mytilus edulis]
MLCVLFIALAVVVTVTAQKNLTPFGKATQSSQYLGNSIPPPENAINPPISNEFGFDKCTHTSLESTPSWWMFNISYGIVFITDIKIYYREGSINMSNIDDQIAEISRQIQSLSESTIQHGQGLISSTPKDQGVRPMVVEDKDRYFHPKLELTKNQSTAHNVNNKPSKYDGNTSWIDYLAHFEMCTLVNMWSEHQKGLYLAVSLIGQAQAVLGDLPKEKRQIFSDLVNALEERFAPSSQTELYRVQFKECRQKVSETLPGLGQSVRRLSNLAYPTAPLELRDTLAKEQFIDALVDSEMRLRIKQSRPKGLNDAIRLAVELEAYNMAESKTLKSMGHLRQTTSDERTEAPNSPETAIKIQCTEGTHKNDFDTDGTVKTLKSEAKFVVDTGATPTLVSSRVYALFSDLCRPHLSEQINLDFDKEKFTSKAVVNDLHVQVAEILCLEFVKKNNCLIAVSANLLRIDDFEVPLHVQGTQNRNANLYRKPCRLTSDRQSKTDRDCSKREQSPVNIVTSQIQDKGKDLSLIELQSNDSDLKLVKRWLTEGQRPQYNEVSGKGYSIRSLWSQFGCLEVHGDVVVRRHMDRELNVVKLQAVIPMSERKQVLQCCHETKCAGHLGIHKTIEKIRQSFYWPGLQSDVRTYVAGCNQCTRRKRSMVVTRVRDQPVWLIM